MKRILLLTLLLGLVVSANAGLTILVRPPGASTWADYPDSKLTISQSDILEVATLGIGLQPGVLALGIAEGPGVLDGSSVWSAAGVTAEMTDDAVKAAALGIQNMFITLTIAEPIAAGQLIRDVDMHCEGPGDVVLWIFDYDTGAPLDSQIIHQIPEPMTLAMLGFGCLALRLKRKR